jgi:hypothetical protein
MKDEKSNDQSDEKPVGLLGDSLGFKLSIAIPIGLGGLILLVILGMNWETMEFCSTGACINYWAVYFRVPLLIMSFNC